MTDMEQQLIQAQWLQECQTWLLQAAAYYAVPLLAYWILVE
jgi:hypothetical protein